MKCEGCPFHKWWTSELGTGRYQFRACGKEPEDCHLISAAFPRLRAEIAGEFNCGYCDMSLEWKDLRGSYLYCDVVEADVEGDWFCADWQPREDKPCPECGGSKVVECFHCGGEGADLENENEDCWECEGTGELDCPTCTGKARE